MVDERTSADRIANIMGSETPSPRNSRDETAHLVQELEKPPIYTDVAEAENQAPAKEQKGRQFLIWTVINTLATIAIVFTNKQIFKDASLRRNQSTFAAFHFAVTAGTLWYASRPRVGMFVAQRAPLMGMLPLGVAMCLNVILPNLSLAYSSVAFYQLARVLLTPLTAIINFVFYGQRMPRQAVYCLLPICLGVAIMSYFDTKGGHGSHTKTAQTTPLGVMFAMVGVLASSLYTVWIGTYHKKFNLNSMQLLFNQAPISAFLLLYVIPFTDETPQWTTLGSEKYLLILFSGLMAALINISQFFIVAGAGAVSSTVIGHLKTCSIVALGWITSGRSANDRGLFGIFMAITGIVMYSKIMFEHKKAQQEAQKEAEREHAKQEEAEGEMANRSDS